MSPEWPTWDPWEDQPIRLAPEKPKAPTHGRCKSSCCKTPYGHAMQVRSCSCHPEDTR